MLNQNIPFDIDFSAEKYDDLYLRIRNFLFSKNQAIINIPDFIVSARKILRIDIESIKLGLVIVSKRHPGTVYLERISEPYTDKRRHYILYDGFIRNRIIRKQIY